jgi:hypothetical protein
MALESPFYFKWADGSLMALFPVVSIIGITLDRQLTM